MIVPQLVEQTTRHQVFLERVKTSEADKFAEFLREMDRSLRRRLGGVDVTELSRARMERLLSTVDNDLSLIYDNFLTEATGGMLDIAEYEAGFESRSINKVLNGFETVVPPFDQVRAAVFSAPLSVRGIHGGKLLETFLRDMTETETQRITGAIRQGYFEGETTSSILRRIRGTSENRFSDGLLKISERNAEAIIRTGVQHAASTARQETWKANRRLITSVRWVSTLDGRTTAICRNLDGTKWPVDEGPRPPIHVNCRSTTVVELDGRFSFLDKDATRSSSSGPVSAKQTYYAWLKTQPVKFQNEAVGVKRSTLLRNGGLTEQRFRELNMDKQFNSMTLDEMRKIEPLAFEKAGL